MTDLYAVVCDCDGDGKPGRLIAWIDDRRPQAEHVFIQSNTGFTKSLRGAQTKGGAWYTYTFRCPGCGRNVEPLSEVTADEIIDKLIPIRDTLAFRPIPSLHQPDRRSDEQRAADQARMAKLLEDQLDGRAPPVPTGLYEGPFEVYENRYVIPFRALNRLISGLRARGRP